MALSAGTAAIATRIRREPRHNPAIACQLVYLVNPVSLPVFPFGDVMSGATASQEQRASRECECDDFLHGVPLD